MMISQAVKPERLAQDTWGIIGEVVQSNSVNPGYSLKTLAQMALNDEPSKGVIPLRITAVGFLQGSGIVTQNVQPSKSSEEKKKLKGQFCAIVARALLQKVYQQLSHFMDNDLKEMEELLNLSVSCRKRTDLKDIPILNLRNNETVSYEDAVNTVATAIAQRSLDRIFSESVTLEDLNRFRKISKEHGLQLSSFFLTTKGCIVLTLQDLKERKEELGKKGVCVGTDTDIVVEDLGQAQPNEERGENTPVDEGDAEVTGKLAL